MTDGSEEESSNEIDESNMTQSTAQGVVAELKMGFSAGQIQEKLNDDEYPLALILTATRLESILGKSICQHYGWTPETFKDRGFADMSLGAYLEECTTSGVLKKYEDHLNTMRSGEKQIVELRNNLVHNYGYFRDVERNEDVQKEVKAAIEYAIEFIEDVKVKL